MDNDITRYLKILLPITIGVIGLLGFYLIIYYIFPVAVDIVYVILGALSPFILAVILAILVDPIVKFFVLKIKLPRSLSVIISLMLIFGIIILLLIMLSSHLIIELKELSDVLSNLSNDFMNLGWKIVQDVRAFISNNPLPVDVRKAIEENISGIIESVKSFLGASSEWLISFLAKLPIIITIALVSFVATYFISKDKDNIYNFFIKMIPIEWIKPLNKIIGTMTSALFGFLRAQAILISVTTILTIIGLSILGLDYSFSVGVLTGIFDLIPILGPGAIFIPWAIWNLIVGKTKFAIALIILYAIIVIIRQMIEPKVLSHSIGLHPLATLMAIFIGLRLLGVIGLFVGPIILLLIKTFIEINQKGEI
ncbi:sporulation integral membrane protein YtvI [Desulfonispora thiosulfatigenes DSM 11270]|uniref:Sporulation integral membrane protein YtvI n=1 Tax=Desulfonispora thiosulfatigenes DSM 11270 TaxID=656914 RepID=A0A1W1VL15_DESTI|nr:sporulation integral membrane protein YtvI [Desulfonispora thiosulfatigenes]SMB94018.1 sporulation integral membrane protein YtvI [Desulfonispora thiosulfatigenes DSM 11270]